MKKVFIAAGIASILGFGIYKGWQLSEKKNAVTYIKYTVKQPTFIDAAKDKNGNFIIHCTIDIVFSNLSKFDYPLRGVSLLFLENATQVAQIVSKNSVPIAPNTDTISKFDLYINLGNSLTSILKIFNQKEVLITVNGLADYSFLTIPFTSSFNLAETLLKAGIGMLTSLLYKLLF